MNRSPFSIFQYILFSLGAIGLGFIGMFFVMKVISLGELWNKLPKGFTIFERKEEIAIPEKEGGALGLLAKSYIVKRLDTGEILYSYRPDVVLPIASITKLVTAVVAEEALNPEDRVTITQDILSTEGWAGSLRLGESLRVRELMYPLLMVSSNDAAEAIARAQSRTEFLSLMNRWVRGIGTVQTTFADPSGLSARNTSTAREILAILEYIRSVHDGIIDITRLKNFSVRSHAWQNPTSFLNLSQYQGGKNGYTEEANRTAALLFEIPMQSYGDEGEKIPIAVVLLGSSDRTKDVLKILDTLEKDIENR